MKKILFVLLLLPTIVLANTQYQNELKMIKQIQMTNGFDPNWKSVKNESGLPAKMFRNNHNGFNGVKCQKNNTKILKKHYPELKKATHKRSALKEFPFFCVMPFNNRLNNTDYERKENKVKKSLVKKDKRKTYNKKRKEPEYKAWENWNTDLKEFDEWQSVESFNESKW